MATFYYNINASADGDYVNASLSLASAEGATTWGGISPTATFYINGSSYSTTIGAHGSGTVSVYVGRGQGYNKTISVSCSISPSYLTMSGQTAYDDYGNPFNVQNNASLVVNGSAYVTLEALPIPKQTITLDASNNNGYFTGGSKKISTEVNKGSSYALPNSFKNNAAANENTNWECIGYTTVLNGKSIQYKVGQSISVDNDIVLYPIFRKKLFFTFLREGLTNQEVGNYIYNNETQISIVTPPIPNTKKYIAKYWNDNTTQLNDSTKVNQNTTLKITTTTSGKTYYAAYDTTVSITYTSEYETNTVIDTKNTYAIYNNIYYIPNQSFSIRKNDDKSDIITDITTIFKRYGYHSNSWLNSTTNSEVLPESIINTNKDITLIAIWTAAMYKVTYDANTGTITKGATSTYVQWGNNIDISRNHFAYKLGKGFKGWSVDPDAEVRQTQIIMPDNAITIYAVYGTNIYINTNSGFKEGNSYICLKNEDGTFSFKECDTYVNNNGTWELSTTYEDLL